LDNDNVNAGKLLTGLLDYAMWEFDTEKLPAVASLLRRLYFQRLYLPPLLAINLLAERSQFKQMTDWAISRPERPDLIRFMEWFRLRFNPRSRSLTQGGEPGSSRWMAFRTLARVLMDLVPTADEILEDKSVEEAIKAAVEADLDWVEGRPGSNSTVWELLIERLADPEPYTRLIPRSIGLFASRDFPGGMVLAIDPFLVRLLEHVESEFLQLKKPPAATRRGGQAPEFRLSRAGEYARPEMGPAPENFMRLVPSELALLLNRDTSLVFWDKHQQGALQQAFYQQEEESNRVPELLVDVMLGPNPSGMDYKVKPGETPRASWYRAIGLCFLSKLVALTSSLHWHLQIRIGMLDACLVRLPLTPDTAPSPLEMAGEVAKVLPSWNSCLPLWPKNRLDGVKASFDMHAIALFGSDSKAENGLRDTQAYSRTRRAVQVEVLHNQQLQLKCGSRLGELSGAGSPTECPELGSLATKLVSILLGEVSPSTASDSVEVELAP